MRGLLLVFALLVALAAPLTPAHAGGPKMLFGAAEDLAKQPTIADAKGKLDLLRLAGFDSVRVTSIWDPGEEAPPANELTQLRSLTGAAALTGMRVFVAVYHFGSRTTPLTAEQQDQFARYAASIPKAVPAIRYLIIGNEPNLNRFWLPQFGPNGENVAAVAYLSLLARTYDRVKAVSPDITVIGGAISPRGNDRPDGIRLTHSPTTFIRDLGVAYRASGRTIPIMDWLAIHPYPENSSTPPTLQHPNTTSIGVSDYDKLVRLLAEAFDGTAQPGSTLPILYAEFGVETVIPAVRASQYHGREPDTIKPVDEATQGRFYSQALSITFCQPNVVGFFIFHAIDETDLDRFQSGLFYGDQQTQKASLPVVREAARSMRGGVLARCPGLELTPAATVRFPTARAVRSGAAMLRLTTDLDTIVYARIERADTHATKLVARGRTRVGEPATIPFPARPLPPGTYRVTVSLTAQLNAGEPRRVASRTFRIL
jgi:hypothetical protein